MPLDLQHFQMCLPLLQTGRPLLGNRHSTAPAPGCDARGSLSSQAHLNPDRPLRRIPADSNFSRFHGGDSPGLWRGQCAERVQRHPNAGLQGAVRARPRGHCEGRVHRVPGRGGLWALCGCAAKQGLLRAPAAVPQGGL